MLFISKRLIILHNVHGWSGSNYDMRDVIRDVA